MTYEWKSNRLKSTCKAILLDSHIDDKGEEVFHLKSQMSNTINARGHGKSIDAAKLDLEDNIINLYPAEQI